MPKYYVRSGHLERVVVAPTPEDAAYKAICVASGEEIDKAAFYVDERGFRGPTPAYQYFETILLPEYMLNTNTLLNKWEGNEDE